MTSDSILYGDDNYFGTVGPTDELFSIRDLLLVDSQQKGDREEFEQNLYASIRGIKQMLDSVKLQIKTKGDPESIYQTKIKVNELMNEL